MTDLGRVVSQRLQLERSRAAPTAAAANSHVVDGLAGTTYRHGDASAVPPCASIGFQGAAAHKLELPPEILVPAQWHSAIWDASLVPEKRLLLAVLEEAIAAVQRYVVAERRRGRRLYREAEAWVLSDDMRWPCTFRRICEALGIDPDYLREGVMRWGARRRAHVSDGHQHYKRVRRLSASRTRMSNQPVGAARPKAS
jgi:hypothetical protein